MPRRWTLSSCIVHRLDTPLPPSLYPRESHLFLSSLFSTDSQLLSTILLDKFFIRFLPIELEDEHVDYVLSSYLLSFYIEYIYLSSWNGKAIFSPKCLKNPSVWETLAQAPFFPRPGQRDYTHSEISGGPSFSLRRPTLNGPWFLGWISVSGRATTRRVARARGESFIHLPRGEGTEGEEETCGQPRLHHEISSSCTCFVLLLPLPVCVGRFHDSLPGANLSILFRPWSLERVLIDRMQRDASITSCPSFETASDFEGIQRFEQEEHIEIEIDRVT